MRFDVDSEFFYSVHILMWRCLSSLLQIGISSEFSYCKFCEIRVVGKMQNGGQTFRARSGACLVWAVIGTRYTFVWLSLLFNCNLFRHRREGSNIWKMFRIELRMLFMLILAVLFCFVCFHSHILACLLNSKCNVLIVFVAAQKYRLHFQRMISSCIRNVKFVPNSLCSDEGIQNRFIHFML